MLFTASPRYDQATGTTTDFAREALSPRLGPLVKALDIGKLACGLLESVRYRFVGKENG